MLTAEQKTAFDLLGVSPTDSPADIRKAWRALVRTYHPDQYRGDKAGANARLAELNAAYDVVEAFRPEDAKAAAHAAARRADDIRKAEARRRADASRRAAEARRASAARKAEEDRRQREREAATAARAARKARTASQHRPVGEAQMIRRAQAAFCAALQACSAQGHQGGQVASVFA